MVASVDDATNLPLHSLWHGPYGKNAIKFITLFAGLTTKPWVVLKVHRQACRRGIAWTWTRSITDRTYAPLETGHPRVKATSLL